MTYIEFSWGLSSAQFGSNLTTYCSDTLDISQIFRHCDSQQNKKKLDSPYDVFQTLYVPNWPSCTRHYSVEAGTQKLG